jgi:hypothetical protein
MTDRDDDPLLDEVRREGGGVVSGIATAASLLVIGLTATFAPRIEGALFPIFRTNDIPPSSVVRSGRRLCWTRIGEKLRTPALNDVDVDVDYVSDITGKLAHQPTPELFEESTGDELTSDVIPPAGPFLKRVCLTLSRRIRQDQPVRVRQVSYFQSVTGLYDIPVVFPAVIDPPNAASVFANRHDSAPGPSDDAVAGPPPSKKPLPQRNDIDVMPMLQDIQAYQPTGNHDLGARIEARVPQELHDRLDDWMAQNRVFNRSEAVRRLMDEALDAEDKAAAEPFEPEGR